MILKNGEKITIFTLITFYFMLITLVFKKSVIFSTENWSKLQKVVQNRRKLVKIAENWSKWPKIAQNRRKLVKIAENCDHNFEAVTLLSPLKADVVLGKRKRLLFAFTNPSKFLESLTSCLMMPC
jgi:hypothetical protein